MAFSYRFIKCTLARLLMLGLICLTVLSKINRFSFSVRCDDMEQMGKCMDTLAADADFAAWQMKYFCSSTIKENIIGRMIAEG